MDTKEDDDGPPGFRPPKMQLPLTPVADPQQAFVHTENTVPRGALVDKDGIFQLRQDTGTGHHPQVGTGSTVIRSG